MNIPKNMGKYDRAVRIAISVILFLLIVLNIVSGWPAILLGIVAIIFAITSFVGFCPLYALIRFSTNKSQEK
jgi:hypothetical protein